MAERYNVELKSNSDILFPGECVICGRNANSQQRAIQIGPLDHHLAFSKIKNTIDVPMHSRCSNRFGLAFLKRYGFVLLLSAIILVVRIIYVDVTIDPPGQYALKRIIFMIVFFVIIIPFALWHFHHPLPVECEYEKGNYIFTFKDRTYAERFAQINKTTVNKKV